ncbi:MAG TPA: hypothetical protein VGK99_08540 [Acidobacteriota bacterium]|jgi:hypothetical protein
MMKISPKLQSALISVAVSSTVLILLYALQSYFKLSKGFMGFIVSLMLLLLVGSAFLLPKYKSAPVLMKRSLIALTFSLSILAVLFGIKAFYMDINIPFYLIAVLFLGPALPLMLRELNHRK